MSEIHDLKLETETSQGTRIRVPVSIQYADDRIWFVKSPFALKEEIKAMKGSRWHGNDDDNPRKMWSIEDCQRNRLQLDYLAGKDVYEWFDRELIRHEYDAPLMPHQRDMTDAGLTYHYQIWGAEMGVGKTLSAQKLIEMSGKTYVWWVGPKTSIPNIQREFRIWKFPFDAVEVEFLSYDEMVRRIDDWQPGDRVPNILICDEASKLKNHNSQRSQAAQMLADMIRDEYGLTDGYVTLMSGTPSPKSPVDWWSLCEITWPGFLREGSARALEKRLAFLTKMEFDAGVFAKNIGWKDDETKCNICGRHRDVGPHELDGIIDPDDFHKYEPSKNEVAYMYERLQGLVIIKHKKDCLTLPDKRYRKILCKPSESILRVAAVIANSAPNAITGATLLRELSDGFQYRDVQEGTSTCTHCENGSVAEWFDPRDTDRTFQSIDMLDPELVQVLEKREVPCPVCAGTREMPKIVRHTREVPCPKDKALRMLLEECEETGRIVVFAGFTGSVDRVVNLCRKAGWSVVRCDGRGFEVTAHEAEVLTDVEPLDYWADVSGNPRVAFVAHPESGGMSLTLVESRLAVFWSNSFKPEYRSQAEDRIHRKGMDENLGCTIVDLIHLPSDERVLTVIQENRRLELMTMGEFNAPLESTQDETVATEVIS